MKFLLITVAGLSAMAGAARAEAREEEQLFAYLERNRASLVIGERGTFSLTTSAAVTMSAVDLGFASSSTNQFSASLSASYVVAKNTEVSVDIPVGRLKGRQSVLGERSTDRYRTGLVTLGVRRVMAFDTARFPEVVASLSYGHPTGTVPADEPNVRAGLTAFRLLDPVLVSVGVGTSVGTSSGRQRLDADVGVDFAVSEEFSLGIGVGFTGAGPKFGDPLRTGVTLTLSGAVVVPSGSSFRPYITLGATEAAPDVAFGLSWSRKW